MNRYKSLNFLILFIVVSIIFAPKSFASKEGEEYFTVVAEKTGNPIFQTAMKVNIGDYYINDQNKKYKIIKVSNNKCIARFEGTVKLLEDEDNLFALTQGLLAQQANKLITIYNTHSDESYEPTSGTHSEPGDGDVYNVAAMLAKAFEKKGIDVVHNKSKHDPHDGGAYERSRRTAMRLVRKNPDAIFDIHRDGVPDANEYTANIDGKKFGQIRLVVGRQNPQMQVNDKFAKGIKAIVDKHNPGLVKGIFYAKGKYNQDLSPRALLLEFATYKQPEEAATVSVNLFADSVSKLLYGDEELDAGVGGTTTNRFKGSQNTGAFSSIFIILMIILIAAAFLFFLNKGGILNNGDTGELSNSLGVKEDDEDNEE